MNTVKVLKKNAVIKDLSISYSFYARLSELFMLLASPEELVRLKQEDEKQFSSHIETFAILFATIDELAEAQGLTELASIEDLRL